MSRFRESDEDLISSFFTSTPNPEERIIPYSTENQKNAMAIAELLNLTKRKDDTEKLPKEAKTAGWGIVGYKTNKHKIKQRKSMEDNIIPRHASSCIFNGKSGSGKTMLMINLLTRPEFFGVDGNKGHYFDKIYLFSPTANNGDDLVRFLKHPRINLDINTDFDIEKLDGIIRDQASEIEKKGLLKSPKILIIFEDIQSDERFMRSKSFLKCFIQCRHLNISTFLLGQSWTRTPRACRLQANNIFFFPGSLSEQKILIDEFCPPRLTKNEFAEMISYATSGPHDFLHVNMRAPMEDRFRKNLDVILKLKK